MIYKYGFVFTSISDYIIPDDKGYPPNMKPGTPHEFLPSFETDIYDRIKYIEIGNNLIKLFKKENTNFNIPIFKSNTYEYINVFTKLRFLRYYLTYENTNPKFKKYLNVVNAETFEDMYEYYNEIVYSII
jgi:hypothetical protein